MPLLAVPDPRYTAPLTPVTATPDPTNKEPLPPVLPVPVLNTNRPLTPAVPAFAVLINSAPLVVNDPYPLTRDTRPPDAEADVDVPADRISSPPVPLLPDPTVTYTDPPRPNVAVPEPIYNPPLLPTDEVPVLNTNRPLTPAVPEFAVLINNAPLVVPDP